MAAQLLRQAGRQHDERRRQRRDEQSWADVSAFIAEATDRRHAADLQKGEESWRREAEQHGDERQRQGDGLAASLHAAPSGRAPAGQRRGKHAIDIAAGEQPARQHHHRPQPLASLRPTP